MANFKDVTGIDIKEVPILSDEETKELIKKGQMGDLKALDKLAKGYFPLILGIACHYTSDEELIKELFQVGSLEFIKKIYKFDISLGTKLHTYATDCINGQIKNYFRDNGQIKITRRIKEKMPKIRKYIEEQEKLNGHSPTFEELSQEFDVDKTKLISAFQAMYNTVSVNEEMNEDGNTTIDYIVVPPEKDIIDNLAFYKAFEELNSQEKKLLVDRFIEKLSQRELAERDGTSQMIISREEKRVKAKAKRLFIKAGFKNI